MTAILSPTPVFKAFANDGTPLAYGLLYSYAAGSTTPQATYVDSTQTTQNTNPIVLNARGECALWLNPALIYKFNLTDINGNQIAGYPVDQIQGSLTQTALIAILTQAFIGAILYPQTSAEIAAGVTPTNYSYTPGDIRRYGVNPGSGSDDTTPLTSVSAVSGTYLGIIPYTSSGYTTNSGQIPLPNNAHLSLPGNPTITCTKAGADIFHGVSLTGTVSIEGGIFVGANSSTTPLSGYGGFSANNTGILTFVGCNDVRIRDAKGSTFFNCISVQSCARVWVEDCDLDTFQNSAIIGPDTTLYIIDRNHISNCTQTGGAVAYGIQMTGDNANGHKSQNNSISFNTIDGIESWYAIESHDTSKTIIHGNIITNCRSGVSVGHLVSTNICEDIFITGNYFEATTVDTWAGAAAEHAGFSVSGFNAANQTQGAVIANNIVRGMFNIAGSPLFTSQSGALVCVHTNDCTFMGNKVIGSGAAAQSAGIYVTGTCNRLTIGINSLQGSFTRHAVRIDTVTADAMVIDGVASVVTTVGSQNGINISGSTIPALSIGGNPTNSTNPYVDDAPTSVLGFVGGTPRSTFTGTLTGGVTGTPTGTFIYQVIDDVVFLQCPTLTATSTSTAQPVITGVPANITPATSQSCCQALVTDNTGTVSGSLAVVGTGNTITLFLGASSTFAASGTKGIVACTISYRRAA